MFDRYFVCECVVYSLCFVAIALGKHNDDDDALYFIYIYYRNHTRSTNIKKERETINM